MSDIGMFEWTCQKCPARVSVPEIELLQQVASEHAKRHASDGDTAPPTTDTEPHRVITHGGASISVASPMKPGRYANRFGFVDAR